MTDFHKNINYLYYRKSLSFFNFHFYKRIQCILNTCTYIYVYTHTHTHIYMNKYIYIIPRGRERNQRLPFNALCAYGNWPRPVREVEVAA